LNIFVASSFSHLFLITSPAFVIRSLRNDPSVKEDSISSMRLCCAFQADRAGATPWLPYISRISSGKLNHQSSNLILLPGYPSFPESFPAAQGSSGRHSQAVLRAHPLAMTPHAGTHPRLPYGLLPPPFPARVFGSDPRRLEALLQGRNSGLLSLDIRPAVFDWFLPVPAFSARRVAPLRRTTGFLLKPRYSSVPCRHLLLMASA